MLLRAKKINISYEKSLIFNFLTLSNARLIALLGVEKHASVGDQFLICGVTHVMGVQG